MSLNFAVWEVRDSSNSSNPQFIIIAVFTHSPTSIRMEAWVWVVCPRGSWTSDLRRGHKRMNMHVCTHRELALQLTELQPEWLEGYETDIMYINAWSPRIIASKIVIPHYQSIHHFTTRTGGSNSSAVPHRYATLGLLTVLKLASINTCP